MKILITGSTGFLGKNLAEYLSDRHVLLLPNHQELDLLDAQVVEKYLHSNKIDVVIHAAAISIVRGKNADPEATQKNLEMFYNLVNHKNFFGKMIFCGSGAVYDKRKNITMVKETDFGKSIPIDPYGVYKYECSKYIEQSEKIIDLRLFGVYGKYEDCATRFISNAICRAILNIPLIIIQNVKFEYLYVNDFVKIVEYFINNEAKHKSYNIGTGEPIGLLELAQKIKKIFSKELKIETKSSGLGNEYTCDNHRLLEALGSFEFSNLDTNLIELYNWYDSNKQNIDINKLQFDK